MIEVEDEWVVRMSVRAWRTARELEANCDQCGLDWYLQAQIMLMAAEEPEEELLWEQVWEYVQSRTCAGWSDRFLVVLDK